LGLLECERLRRILIAARYPTLSFVEVKVLGDFLDQAEALQ